MASMRANCPPPIKPMVLPKGNMVQVLVAADLDMRELDVDLDMRELDVDLEVRELEGLRSFVILNLSYRSLRNIFCLFLAPIL